MSDRISMTILLCEDSKHESLVRSYWSYCGHKMTSAPIEVKNASRIIHGGNITYVLEHFVEEVRACRVRHQAKANTLLIVVADADQHSVADREQHLLDRAKFADSDPLVVLIPKCNIETWICSAIGHAVTEEEDCKKHKIGRAEIREAARQIHEWARDGASEDSTCVPSLRVALPRWRKIG